MLLTNVLPLRDPLSGFAFRYLILLIVLTVVSAGGSTERARNIARALLVLVVLGTIVLGLVAWWYFSHWHLTF